MKTDEKFPTIRIRRLANKHADEVVAALKAKGIETSKTTLVSDLILSIPLPEVAPTPTSKRRPRKVEETAAQSSALA
jgi:hypothetical protein